MLCYWSSVTESATPVSFGVTMMLSSYYDLSHAITILQPCEQRFLSCMAFSVYEVFRLAWSSSTMYST